jgi:oligopeptide transport system permease protein
MLAYAARRLVAIPPTLFIIVTLAFAVVRAAPGGPFDAEQSLPPQVKANLERAYGLDQPLITQYLRYLRTATSGRR